MEKEVNHILKENLLDIVHSHDIRNEIIYILIERLIDDYLLKGADRYAPILSDKIDEMSIPKGTFINIIPGNLKGPCSGELLVICYNKDSIHERLREMLYCAGITCRGRNNKVFFITTKWEPNNYKIHSDAIEVLRNEGVEIIFILLGNKGISEIYP